jgi:hypothetical protein
MVANHTPIKPRKKILREIKKRLKYYPNTGKLFWITSFFASRIGKEAGFISKAGYVIVTVGLGNQKYVKLKAHHIAWYLYYGEWPSREVDHRNTIEWDNRIKNLRLATRVQACRNRGLQSNNKSGITGVYIDNRIIRKYQAYITLDNKLTTLGRFYTIEEAIAARKLAEKKYYNKFSYRGVL